MRVIPLLACCLAAAFATPASSQSRAYPQAPARAAVPDLSARFLAAHNQERARWGVPPLRWNPQLAFAAATYGPTLARLRSLEHSPRNSRPGQAENLWMGPAGRYTPEQMVGSWSSERAWFRPGLFPNVSTTGNWLDVSHYTQMIWRTTTEVGCAIHRGGGWDYLICRYSPRGNQDNRQVP